MKKREIERLKDLEILVQNDGKSKFKILRLPNKS